MLTKRYSIQDIYKYGFRNITLNTSASHTITDDTLTWYGGKGAGKSNEVLFTHNGEWEISFDIKTSSMSGGMSFGLATPSTYFQIGIESREYYGSQKWNIRYNKESISNYIDRTVNQVYSVKIIRTNDNKIQFYVNNNLINTISGVNYLNEDVYIGLHHWSCTTSQYQTISNFKVKLL